MTASRSAGWLPRSTGAPRSRASRSSRNAVALAALRNMPSVDGPSRCRTASSSCGRERQEDGCLAEELPCNSGGQSAAPAAAPCPQTGLGAEACCGGEEPNGACAELLGTASASAEQAEGGLGTAWPGWLTWMGRGSVPSSPQMAARGCPKSGLLQPEPACPGAWAAAGLRRRAKGQGSPLLLLLLLLPPAAKEKRARARQCRPPGQRSRSLPCPALPCPACSVVLSGAAGQAGSQQLEL